jgi:hypothetical protein
VIEGVRFSNIEDGSRVAKAAGTSFNPLVDQTIARVDKTGTLMGGVIYKEYTGMGGSIAMHAAKFHNRWLNRTMLWIFFDYPFNQLGVKKIFGQVPMSKPDVIDFDKHLGFREELIVKDVYPDGDMMLLSMKREACVFLRFMPQQLVKE